MNEQANDNMTIKGAVEKVIEVLGKLEIPVSKMETLGMPISGCIAILNGCVEAWEQEEKEKQKEGEKTNE